MTNFLPSIAFLLQNSHNIGKDSDKTAFPVASSTLSSSALADLLYSQYSIDLPRNCYFWHRGLSDVYLLETLSSFYIFRVSHCHWRSKTEIDFELQFLDYLKGYDVPVAAPINTKDGDLSIEILAAEGKRYGVLFPYAPGEIAIGDFNCYQARQLGGIVAHLHSVCQDFKPLAHRHPLNSTYLLDKSLQIIAPFLHHRPSDLHFLLETVAEIKGQLEYLPGDFPYWGVCWGDPHSGNVHITGDNQMTLFDFDQCGYGWRVFDVAKFFQVSLQSGLSRSVRQAFLQAYDHIASLTGIEWSVLQSLTQAAYIWSWSISLNNTILTDYSRLDCHYFNHRLQGLKRLKCKDWELF